MPEEKTSYWTVFEKMTFKVEKKGQIGLFLLKKLPPKRQKWLYQKFKKSLVVLGHSTYVPKVLAREPSSRPSGRPVTSMDGQKL